MRSISHWSADYLFARTLQWLDQKTHPYDPWLTRHSINILDKYLKKSDLGIEWGSGRSTLWFANRVSRLISVEDNIVWYKTVSAQLNGAGLANVEYHFLEIKEKASVLELGLLTL